MDKTNEISITIIPELESLLPALDAEERSNLEKSVESEGIKECLTVWPTVDPAGNPCRILADGHNRYRIWKNLGREETEMPIRDVQFTDMAEVKDWIISNQLMRRNLPNGWRSYLRGKAYLRCAPRQDQSITI